MVAVAGEAPVFFGALCHSRMSGRLQAAGAAAEPFCTWSAVKQQASKNWDAAMHSFVYRSAQVQQHALNSLYECLCERVWATVMQLFVRLRTQASCTHFIGEAEQLLRLCLAATCGVLCNQQPLCISARRDSMQLCTFLGLAFGSLGPLTCGHVHS